MTLQNTEQQYVNVVAHATDKAQAGNEHAGGPCARVNVQINEPIHPQVASDLVLSGHKMTLELIKNFVDAETWKKVDKIDFNVMLFTPPYKNNK